MIINKMGDLFFGVNNLARKNAKAQNNAKILGKIITAKGIRNIWYVSATKNAEPIQWSPNENQPNPRNQEAKKVFLSEGIRLIE